MTSSQDAWLDQVIAMERRLLEPSTRANARVVEALLHPDFREVGASGRVWRRASMIENLTSDGGSTTAILDEEMEGTLLADGVVLLTYVSDAGGRRARRASIWIRGEDACWRLLHHQGTLTE